MNMRCQVCQSEHSELLADFGRLPLTSRFLKDKDENCDRHNFLLFQCMDCGLIQQANPFTDEQLKVAPLWFRHTEHEDHLDGLLDHLIDIGLIKDGQKIAGLSYKDASFIERINNTLDCKAEVINPLEDLTLEDCYANGPEAIQASISGSEEKIIRRYGRFDVLILRHILEHATLVKNFLETLNNLLKDNGVLVVEVPEISQQLDTSDYCMLWGEHVSYFTPKSLNNTLSYLTGDVQVIKTFHYPTEGCLLGVVRKDASHGLPEVSVKTLFGSDFKKYRESIRTRLLEVKKKSGKVCIFGASHVGFMFAELFGLQGIIYCFLDDNENKQGTFSPGSGIPVKPSSVLREESIECCLIAINPAREDRILEIFSDVVEKGTAFHSIYRSSKLAL